MELSSPLASLSARLAPPGARGTHIHCSGEMSIIPVRKEHTLSYYYWFSRPMVIIPALSGMLTFKRRSQWGLSEVSVRSYSKVPVPYYPQLFSLLQFAMIPLYLSLYKHPSRCLFKIQVFVSLAFRRQFPCLSAFMRLRCVVWKWAYRNGENDRQLAGVLSAGALFWPLVSWPVCVLSSGYVWTIAFRPADRLF